MSFYRSTDANCDLDNYSTCTHGQLDMLNSSAVTDSAATLTRPAWYWLRQGTHTSLASAINATRFSARYGHQAAVFNGKLWLVGGWDGSFKNDVWSSDDGVNWTLVTRNAGFAFQANHQLVAYDNKLWVIAGYDGSSYMNDVWSSSDGKVWVQATSSAAFTPQACSQSVAYDNKLWVIGGCDG
ncbi:MAG: hypothetical protein P8079_10250, partial [Gammaproteobacteria bacterium]